MLCVRRKGFQLLVLIRDLVDLLRDDDLGLDVVLVGLGAPDDTPDELPPESVDIDPFTPLPATGWNKSISQPVIQMLLT